MSEKQIHLSACVIAQNEERSLVRCLESLRFADEVILIDGGSTDSTVDVARKFSNVKLIHQKFSGFSAQRNRALKEASGDWVFFLDADEETSSALAEKLRAIATDSIEKHPACYSVRREEYFLGRHLEGFGPGNPSFQWRFFKRTGVVFQGQVHEFPLFDGPVGEISEPIHHWPNLDIDRFLSKMNRYTNLEALDRFSQGQKTTLLHAFFTFFTTFLKNGIRYRGFWNGKEGLVLVLLESISRTVRHLKLWMLWQVYEKRLKMDLGVTLPEPGSKMAPQRELLEKPVWKTPL